MFCNPITQNTFLLIDGEICFLEWISYYALQNLMCCVSLHTVLFQLMINECINKVVVLHSILDALFTCIYMQVGETQDRKHKLMQFCLLLYTKVQI